MIKSLIILSTWSLKHLFIQPKLTLINVSTTCRAVSCSGVMITSGYVGMMKGEASPWTGTDNTLRNTSDNFCKSPPRKRLLMCTNSAGKVCKSAVRKCCDGTYTFWDLSEFSGGWVAVWPMLSHTFQAAIHNERSLSETWLFSFFIFGTDLTSPVRLITSSKGGWIISDISELSSGFDVSRLIRISWKLLRAASETSAFRHMAADSMWSSSNDHARGKSPEEKSKSEMGYELILFDDFWWSINNVLPFAKEMRYKWHEVKENRIL